MIKPLVHDPVFLGQKSENAGLSDLQTAQDLLDTLTAHKGACVGMAANMIGIKKRIICIEAAGIYITMFNPEIVKKSQPYETQEGCLSLLGGPRKTTRFEKITVKYQKSDFKTYTTEFSGFVAQIIQHEVDHCNGILI